ncbi:MAG: META domain-containing protein [Henriciella sp.]|uniref:META domain-containing protein n=1 Tax=Henriciella sp. TaxID=1968823 RepID=UPI003C715A21
MIRLIAAGLVAVFAAGCETDRSTQPASGEQADAEAEAVVQEEAMQIIGSLVYRQRIALPPGAVATITVFEDGPQDAALDEVASESFALNGRQVPIPFEVTVDPAIELAGNGLSLRATIDNAEGELIWTSDTAYVFERTEGVYELGDVLLAPAGPTGASLEDLTSKEWMVATISGKPVQSGTKITFSFEDGGQIRGNGGCNAFNGSYDYTDGTLSFGPMAMTRKACVGPVMQQEQTFVNVLSKATSVRFNGSDTLLLRTPEGETIAAR